MHLIEFYYQLAQFSDFLPIIPIAMGLGRWKNLSIGLKCFWSFLVADLLINFASYHIHGSNRFLGYFYSLCYCSFILSTYFFFFKDAKEKKSVFVLLFFCLFLLTFDFFLFSGTNENYVSGILIDLVIVGTGIYYFSKYAVQKKYHVIEANLFISIVLIFQFFIKAVEIFLDNFLMETQNNAFLWIQMRNIYYYFMVLSLLSITLIFYKLNFNEHKN